MYAAAMQSSRAVHQTRNAFLSDDIEESSSRQSGSFEAVAHRQLTVAVTQAESCPQRERHVSL